MNGDTIAFIGLGVTAILAAIKAYFVLPMRITALENENAAQVILLAEKTRTIAQDHDTIIRLEERIHCIQGKQ
jgi:hypothetical protein